MKRREKTINSALLKRSGPVSLWLGLVGLGLLSACAPGAETDELAPGSMTLDRTGDTVVVRVDGSPIYARDVRRAAESQGLIGEADTLEPGDPIFKTTLDDLIDQRLLALDAVRSGIANDQEAKRRLAAAQDRILGNYRVERHLEETVTEARIRELYAAQRELAGRGEERRVRRIVVEDQETALEIARRLGDEEDFDTLIETYVTREDLREQSGDMGWVSRNMLSGAVASQAFSTPIAGRSAPFQAGETWQVLEVQDVRTPLSRPFSDVREDISRFMTYEAIETLMSDLRDRAEIERTPIENLTADQPGEGLAQDDPAEDDLDGEIGSEDEASETETSEDMGAE